jgi:hypothetical protein
MYEFQSEEMLYLKVLLTAYLRRHFILHVHNMVSTKKWAVTNITDVSIRREGGGN